MLQSEKTGSFQRIGVSVLEMSRNLEGFAMKLEMIMVFSGYVPLPPSSELWQKRTLRNTGIHTQHSMELDGG